MGQLHGTLLKDKFHRFQSRAPTIITIASYDIRSADLIEVQSWGTLDKRRLRAKSTLMYKMFNDDLGSNLRNSFVRRNTNQTNYQMLLPNTKCFTKLQIPNALPNTKYCEIVEPDTYQTGERVSKKVLHTVVL